MRSDGSLNISAAMWSTIWQMNCHAKRYRSETGSECTLLFIATDALTANQTAVYINDDYDVLTAQLDAFKKVFSKIKE